MAENRWTAETSAHGSFEYEVPGLRRAFFLLLGAHRDWGHGLCRTIVAREAPGCPMLKASDRVPLTVVHLKSHRVVMVVLAALVVPIVHVLPALVAPCRQNQ
jgi:hypothetical protein